MRGAGDQMTVGERIKFYRRRRGLTQEVLANLVGRKVDWLSKIERGERDVRRLDVLSDVARALRVTLADLFGQPVLMEDDEENDNVPAVRDALMTPRRLSRTLFGSGSPVVTADPESSTRFVEEAWDDYQAGRLGRVIKALPGLIEVAQQLEDAASSGEANARHCWAVSARTHHLAATALSKVGEADLAWIAAERSMQAADSSDDPLVLASAARAGTHALLAVGRFDDALSLGNRASEWLAPQMAQGDPSALSLFGMLHLRTAIAAARRQDRPTATELLNRAFAAAHDLDEDGNYWQTGFGPTNVELHRMSAALDLGDVPFVVEHGPSIVVEHLPVERRVTHMIDVARAQSMLAEDEPALQSLLTAEQAAPQLVRHSPMVRETVKAMHRRSPVAGGAKSSPLSGLAERCRAIQ
ncbi:helix-turn-helix domain-containing protein [Allosaccharopolyspora coralli]|uniref:Helix-turn-helix domain-containing protein n=1 Tax=Allosaccharopolyspora coralli TaxID=2665642 RepID=A0A5Q3QDW3_9PSEU|nr:helix-turn-helix transcriptional regulator [Allosaccharopolyspora coralli]QGK68977.1 helix-turn-helix domain-containing protein [Allosaccharopolyspora coralli]